MFIVIIAKKNYFQEYVFFVIIYKRHNMTYVYSCSRQYFLVEANYYASNAIFNIFILLFINKMITSST